LKKYFIILIKLLGIGIIAVMLFIAAVNYDVFGHIYTKEELKTFTNETASLVLSDNGTVIGKYFNKNRTNANFEAFPKHVINALVATEDARFFKHKGIDAKSLFRVLFKTIILRNNRSGGGSTITQQLAKNMYGRGNYGPLTMLINKTKESIQAYRIENTFTKNEILSLYLNTVAFGENVYGIETASLRYFNKPIAKVTIQEGAVLIGVLKANTFYNPHINKKNALKRRNTVLQQMEKYEYLSAIAYDSITQLPLTLNYNNLITTNQAGYFLAMVKRESEKLIQKINETKNQNWNLETDGLQIHTTLDIQLQNYALNAFESHLSTMQQKLRKQYQAPWLKKKLNSYINKKLKKLNLTDAQIKTTQLIFDWKGYYTDSITKKESIRLEETLLHAGLITLNPKNGALKTWVGGIDYNTHPYDQILAKRQMASSFKPIVYAAALESDNIPCHYLSNDSLTVTDFNNWKPQNANHKFGGKYSLTGALINSKNVPTVNLFFETGFAPIQKLWKSLNFSNPLKNTPALALGTTDASLYEVANAYAAFANEGKIVSPYCINKITTTSGMVLYKHQKETPKKVLTIRTTKLLNIMLQKAINQGTGSRIRNTYKIQMPLAGKTGTSQNYADAWFVSYNPNLVMVSRVGASSPKIHFYNGSGAGAKLALPLVAKTLQQIEKNHTLKNKYSKHFPTLPEHLISEMDCIDFKEKTNFENLFDQWFKSYKKDSKQEERKQERRKKGGFFKRLFGKRK